MGKYALLIGVGTYGEGLQPLPAAPNDVAALREVLLNPETGGFNEARSLINPTRPEMAREIELWFQDRQPEDLVLLFFSGHGIKDDRRDLYFAAVNTEKRRDHLLTSTATSAQDIRQWIGRCKANSKVLILDCCFSGAFGDLVGKDDGEIPLKEKLGAEGWVVLTSTSAVDYSFEEKDADLSIYTRYLVEGIATGAADEDGDGVITADEIHRYAGRKVEETSPAMSPKIFIPKGEGYRIHLARSPQDDPKLKYRKEAEHRAAAAEFTIPAKRLLIRLRAELGLSDAEAEAIEAEVLKPHREYRRKRQDYQETLHQCLEQESSLTPRTIQDLKDYRAHLRLKPDDVAAIERSLLSGQDLEGYIADLEYKRRLEILEINGGNGNADPKPQPPDVSRKELSECDPSKILFIKNVRDPIGIWAYTLDLIQKMGGSVESRVFELFWLPSSKGARSASQGDLMLLNQQAKITHIVEMLDDDVRKNSTGYFRWVRVVWMSEETDWSKLPHQREVLGFEPPTIGGGTAYLLANLSKFQEIWNSLEDFQQHVFQVFTGTEPAETKDDDVDDLSSGKEIDYTHTHDYYSKPPNFLSVKGGLYIVVLEEFPPDRKIEVLKAVRQLTGFGLKEVKELIESTPQHIVLCVSEQDAQEAVEFLMAAGGDVSVELHDEYSDGSGSKKGAGHPRLHDDHAKPPYFLSARDGLHTVFLTGFSPNKKIEVLKAVRQLTGFGLKEAKELVESIPQRVVSRVSGQKAKEAMELLMAADGDASIELHDEYSGGSGSEKRIDHPNLHNGHAKPPYFLSARGGLYNVFLTGYSSDKRIEILRAVRQLTGFGLKEAQELVESTPQHVVLCVSGQKAQEAMKLLTAAGGRVSLSLHSAG